MLRTLHSFVCFQTHFICNASTMHWSSLRWCVHFFLLFTLLQTLVHDARLPLKFADYWQDNSRQADCSWNFIQTLEGWMHRFRGLLHKLYTCSISCLDKLELLLQNSFQLKKITVIAMFLLSTTTLMMWKGLTGLVCHLIGQISILLRRWFET